MARFNAFGSGVGIDMSTGFQFAFEVQNGVLFDEGEYSWITPNASVADALGFDIAVLGAMPIGGTITRIDYFLNGGRTDGFEDVRISDIAVDLVTITGSTTAFYDEILQGDDDISGSVFDDILVGGTGNDIINAFGGHDEVYGGQGEDNISGFNGDDYLDGGADNDELEGGGGDDDLRGGSGTDILSGGDDSDRFLLDIADEAIVDDTFSGGSGGVDVDSLMFETGGTYGLLDATFNDLEVIVFGAAGVSDTEVIFDADELADGFFGLAAIDAASGIGTVESIVVVADQDTTVDLGGWAFAGWELSDKITVIGDSSNETIIAPNVSATLRGGGGRDTLRGGLGFDLLQGEGGNDTFDLQIEAGPILDIFEGGFGETDRLLISESGVYDLRSAIINDIEEIDFGVSGNGAKTLLISAAATQILGFSGTTLVDGFFASQDQIEITLGIFDTVDISGWAFSSFDTSAGDRISIFGDGSNETITGSSQADTIDGGGGNDKLTSGGGADTLIGGTGNDQYFVDSSSAVVVEAAGEGIGDYIFSSVSNTIVENIERLYLTGTDNIDATGRDGANDILVGNSGNNTLDGKGGRDIMQGRGGNDVYLVDQLADIVTENAGEGTDFIFTTGSYQIAEHAERLIAVEGANAVGLTARNFQNDIIIGNSSTNVFVDQFGRDIFVGGGGADFFRFIANLDPVNNVNRINDFNSVDDQFQLQQTIYTEIDVGILDASEFVLGTAASDADDRIIYDQPNGVLYYDPDGTGATAQIEIVNVTAGITITADDFQIY